MGRLRLTVGHRAPGARGCEGGRKITQSESSLGWRSAHGAEERNSRTGVVRRTGEASEAGGKGVGAGAGGASKRIWVNRCGPCNVFIARPNSSVGRASPW